MVRIKNKLDLVVTCGDIIIYIPAQITKCLKEKKYSLEAPTSEQKAECEAFAKAKLDEVITLNTEEE